MWEWEIRRFATLGSTNSYLLEQARAGAPEGLVAVADHQSTGRGRLGRRWDAPAGAGLLMSVLLRPVVAATDLHLCAAACTLALAAACETTAGVRPAVKWPNDLVVDDAKLAGVLSESDRSAPGGAPGSTAVVVGMGCNLTWSGPPDVVGTCLADLAGRPVGRDELLDATLAHLARRLGALSEVGGRGGLMDELRRSCATVGRQVRVERGAGADLVGEAVAVTDAGHLVVRQAAGDVEVAAGDVVHLRDVRK